MALRTGSAEDLEALLLRINRLLDSNFENILGEVV